MGNKLVGRLEESCNSCNNKAEIFQAEGDYCLQCWQRETHPNV